MAHDNVTCWLVVNVEPFNGLNVGETTFSVLVNVAAEISELVIPFLTAIAFIVDVVTIVKGELNFKLVVVGVVPSIVKYIIALDVAHDMVICWLVVNVEPLVGLNVGEATFSVLVYVAVEISELVIPFFTAIAFTVAVEVTVKGEIYCVLNVVGVLPPIV